MSQLNSLLYQSIQPQTALETKLQEAISRFWALLQLLLKISVYKIDQPQFVTSKLEALVPVSVVMQPPYHDIIIGDIEEPIPLPLNQTSFNYETLEKS